MTFNITISAGQKNDGNAVVMSILPGAEPFWARMEELGHAKIDKSAKSP